MTTAVRVAQAASSRATPHDEIAADMCQPCSEGARAHCARALMAPQKKVRT